MAVPKSASKVDSNEPDGRRKWDREEYAAKATERDEKEREERRLRYEAKLAGKKYYKPLTGNEVLTSARRTVLDVAALVGKTQLVPAGLAVGKRGRGAGFYCETCDLTFKDNHSFVEHLNKQQHLSNAGQTSEVRRATVEEVRERIDAWVHRLDEQRREGATSLQERLDLRESADAREAEARRARRQQEAERKRLQREEKIRGQQGYGDDVRIEGEHEEDDLKEQLGFSTFASSKK